MAHDPSSGEFHTIPINLTANGVSARLQLDSAGNLKTVAGAPTGTPYTSASLSISSSGDNTGVTGISAKTIRVFSLMLTAASPVDITLKDGSTTLAVFTGVSALVIDPLMGNARWITSASNNFVINLSAAVTVKGCVWYTQS